MGATSNDSVPYRPAVVAEIVQLAERERNRDSELAPEYLVWRAADIVKQKFPNVSEAEQQAAFSQIIRTASASQWACYAALELEIQYHEDVDGRPTAGGSTHETVRQQ